MVAKGKILVFALSRSDDGEWLKPSGGVYPWFWAGKEWRKEKYTYRLILGGASISCFSTRTVGSSDG